MLEVHIRAEMTQRWTRNKFAAVHLFSDLFLDYRVSRTRKQQKTLIPANKYQSQHKCGGSLGESIAEQTVRRKNAGIHVNLKKRVQNG